MSTQIVDMIHPITRAKTALSILLGLWTVEIPPPTTTTSGHQPTDMKKALVELYCPFMANRYNYISLYLAVAFNLLRYDRLCTCDKTAAMKFLKKEFNLGMFLDPLLERLRGLDSTGRLEILRHYLGDVTIDDAEVEEVLASMD